MSTLRDRAPVSLERYIDHEKRYSLKDIIQREKQADVEMFKMETYSLNKAGADLFQFNAENNVQEVQDSQEKTLMLQRLDITLNDKECELINFKDITAFESLQKERDQTPAT